MKATRLGPSMLPDSAERPVVSAEEAFEHLGIDRTTGYRAIREGRFPVEVIRIGRVIRVPTKALRRILELDAGDADDDTDTEDGPSDSDAHWPSDVPTIGAILSPPGSNAAGILGTVSPSPTYLPAPGVETP